MYVDIVISNVFNLNKLFSSSFLSFLVFVHSCCSDACACVGKNTRVVSHLLHKC